MSFFSQKLIQLRTDSGYTQTRFAEAVGLSVKTVSNLERGSK